MVASPASTSTSAAVASADPLNDPAIFRPDGIIVFPRSDGDRNFGPPNTVVPSPNDKEINYFHVWQPGDKQYDRWCKAVATDLAEWAGKPKQPPNGKEWKLKAFPKHYDFTEQRKGLKGAPRTDPYLYGSDRHRFRSSKEFLPHAKWLISDATMSQSNCECRYCTNSKRAVPTTEGAYRKALGLAGHASTIGRTSRLVGASSKGKMAPQGTAKVKAKTLPPPHKRPKLGITVPSSIVRDNELARQAGAQLGECEGYRQGEIVWVTLRPPVIDPAQSIRKIDKWPAQIEDVTFGVDVTPSTEGGKFNLAKRVKQDRRYSIVLIGVPQERAKVTESRLMPYLCTFIDHDVAHGSFGNASDHAWLQSESGFPDNLTLLEGGKSDVTASEWATRLSALAFSLTVCNYLRCRYRLTDPFVVPPAPAKGQTTHLERWPHATKYWQGIYAGLERVWVGDIVRLKLTQQEAHAMLRSLRKEDKLTDEANALWDTKSPYALRLKAIYDERESEGEGEDEAEDVEGSSGIKIAGILYRVQVGGKVSSAEDTDVANGDATGSSDAQAGSKPLAAPKSDLLSTWGETVSRVKMPEGLSLQAVTSKGKEAIMEPVQIAGRLYPSLLRSLKGSLEAAVQGKAADLEAANVASSEDFEDIDAARLAVSGALPGPVRAMCLDDQTTESAEAYLRACLDAGRTDTAALVRDELVKTPAAAAEAPVSTASTSISNASIFDPAIEEAAVKAAEAVESGTIQENVAEDSGEKTSTTLPVTLPNGNDGIAGVPSHEDGKSAVPIGSEPEPIPTDAQRQEQADTKPSVATAANKPSSPPTRAASPLKVSSPPRDPRLARRRRGIDANANGVPSVVETNDSASPSTGTKRKAGSPVDIAASNEAVADKDGHADELVSQRRNNKAAKVADSSSSDLHSSQLATPVKPTSPAPTIVASSPTSTPRPSGQVEPKSAEISAKDATEERQASPPLPPGWIKRTSRQGHGVYYANKNTRETRWDRPTA